MYQIGRLALLHKGLGFRGHLQVFECHTLLSPLRRQVATGNPLGGGWCPLSATLSKATWWPPTSFMSPILAGSWASSVSDFSGNKKLKILIQISTKGEIWDHLLIFDNRVLARWICVCTSKILWESSCGTFCPSGIEYVQAYLILTRPSWPQIAVVKKVTTTRYWICPSGIESYHHSPGLEYVQV